MRSPVLRSISPDAGPEEVAAIVAAVTASMHASASGGIDVGPGGPDRLDAWVRGSRLTARRSGLQRGPWRLAGRVGRRSRA
jgi:hypothetical protein